MIAADLGVVGGEGGARGERQAVASKVVSCSAAVMR
jgi:hypothetical protein